MNLNKVKNTLKISKTDGVASSSSSSTSSIESEIGVLSLDKLEYQPEKSHSSKVKTFFIDLKSYVKEVAETVEVHGLRYWVEEGRSIVERIFWVIVLITSITLCISLIIYLDRIYQNVPVIVSFSPTNSPIFEVPFPAVTICSQVKSNSKNFSYTQLHKSFYKKGMFTNSEEFKFYQYFSLVCDHPFGRYWNPPFRGNFDEYLKNNFFAMIRNVTPKQEDIMFYCTYLSVPMNCSQLFKPVYTSLGVCYSFNMVEWSRIFTPNTQHHAGFFEAEQHGSDWSSKNYFTNPNLLTYPRRSVMPGLSHSLQIFLVQNESELDPVCTRGISGFRVRVHDPLSIPEFENHFVQLGLNSSTIAAITPSVLKTSDVVYSLALKKRKCYLPEERHLKFYREYTPDNCWRECLTNITKQLCGCVPFYLPAKKGTFMCGATKLDCVDNVRDIFELTSESEDDTNEGFASYIKNCDCKESCVGLSYDIQYTVSPLKNAPYNLHVPEKYKGLSISSFLIFFKSTHFLPLEKVEYYGYAELMANIGGLLNFFVGSSVLTLVEILYSFSLKILCNKLIYGPWAGPASAEYNYVLK